MVFSIGKRYKRIRHDILDHILFRVVFKGIQKQKPWAFANRSGIPGTVFS